MLKNMKSMTTKILWGVAALLGCAFVVFKYKQHSLASNFKKVQCLDINFVKDWIATRDMEQYNESYTAVMLRRKELPEYSWLRLFFDMNQVVALCIYDKRNKLLVLKEMFLAENISTELGEDDFIEFPFES